MYVHRYITTDLSNYFGFVDPQRTDFSSFFKGLINFSHVSHFYAQSGYKMLIKPLELHVSVLIRAFLLI